MKKITMNKLKEVLKTVDLPKRRVIGDNSKNVYYSVVVKGNYIRIDTSKDNLETFNTKVIQYSDLYKNKNVVVVTPKEIEHIFLKMQEKYGKITKKELENPLLNLINSKIIDKTSDEIGLEKVSYKEAIDKYLGYDEYNVYVKAPWIDKPVKVSKLKQLVYLGFEDISDLSTVAEFYVRNIK